jgi:hypothetical protein
MVMVLAGQKQEDGVKQQHGRQRCGAAVGAQWSGWVQGARCTLALLWTRRSCEML